MSIPLNILDEYAKIISYKQAKCLYESKLNKKYTKIIYKGTEYQNKNSFAICLNKDMLNEAGITVSKALARYVTKHNLQYNCINEGVYLYTPLVDNYISLLENLMSDGISKKTLCENVDKHTAEYLQN